MLFESLAKHPGWSETLLELIWPPGEWYTPRPPGGETTDLDRWIWDQLLNSYPLALLLAEVAVNAYTGLPEAARRVAFQEAWQWEFEGGIDIPSFVSGSISGVLMDGESPAMTVLLEQWVRYQPSQFRISSVRGASLTGFPCLAQSDVFRPSIVSIDNSNSLREIDAVLGIPSLRSLVLYDLPSLDFAASCHHTRPKVKHLLLSLTANPSLQFALDCPELESLAILFADREVSVRPLLGCSRLKRLNCFKLSDLLDLEVLAERSDMLINEMPVKEAIAKWRQERESLPARK